MLHNDDCLTVLKEIPDMSIDMIYLDPPFFTQKLQKLSNKNGDNYEFSDIWKSKKEYLDFMRCRLLQMQRVLKNEGNIFLHCDTSAEHYLRILLDEIFGEKNFKSSIIWVYKRWSNSQNCLLSNHQTILHYGKTKFSKFNTLYGEYSPTTNIDQILQERERNSFGKAVYKKHNNGEIVEAKEKKGVPLSDVWEIPFLNPKAKERTGYPTQKPIELLERIIKISTNENDIVLDPFCGSGTTLVTAVLQKRRYIGIDINPEAIKLCKERLSLPFKSNSDLLKKGIGAFQTKSEKDLMILKQFDCDIVQRNKGIDAILKKHYNNHPVAIKIQRQEESLQEAISLLDLAGKKKKCSFTILISYELNICKSNLVPSNMVILQTYDAMFENKITPFFHLASNF